jgi:hypothetical protein
MAKVVLTEQQIKLLIIYHQTVVDSCITYSRYTELALEEMTIKALERLILLKVCEPEQ